MHATEGILISNRQGVIIEANPSAETMFGYEAGTLIGLQIEDLMPESFRALHQAHREGYNQKPKARAMGQSRDLFGQRKNGTVFSIEVSLSYYQNAGELQIIAFLMDVTERKQQEERILKMNQGLEEKVSERTQILKQALHDLEASRTQLSQALEREKELNDMKSRFVTMASHEFRTPLSTILSSISLVNNYQGNDEKVQRHVQRIRSAVTNMTLILNDFLSVEKLETGQVLAHVETVNWTALLTEIKQEISGLLKLNQHIEWSHHGPVTAQLDPQLMRNVLLNLISNAIKFSPEDSTILITSRVDANWFELQVMDTGMGIPINEQARLFERFFRAQNALNIQGTGLGLHIVKRYVESMKGTITLESNTSGTRLNISIPQ